MSETYITWSDDLAIDDGPIDADHRHLIGLINQIHVATQTEAPPDNISAILCDLADYSSFHFGREETLMTSVGYVNRVNHIEQHDNFIESLSDLIGAFERGAHISNEILGFVVTWLVLHVRVSDRDFGYHLKRHRQGC